MSEAQLRQTIQAYAAANGVSEARLSRWFEGLGPHLLRDVAQGRVSFIHLAGGLLIPDYYSQSLDLEAGAGARFALLTEYVLQMRDEARRLGAQFTLVYLPSELQFDPRKHELNRRYGYTVRARWLASDSALQHELSQFSRKSGILYLDLTPAFRVEAAPGKPRLVFDEDLHYSAAGHTVVARALIPFLASDQSGGRGRAQ